MDCRYVKELNWIRRHEEFVFWSWCSGSPPTPSCRDIHQYIWIGRNRGVGIPELREIGGEGFGGVLSRRSH